MDSGLLASLGAGMTVIGSADHRIRDRQQLDESIADYCGVHSSALAPASDSTRA
jgi:hypothetical protein